MDPVFENKLGVVELYILLLLNLVRTCFVTLLLFYTLNIHFFLSLGNKNNLVKFQNYLTVY